MKVKFSKSVSFTPEWNGNKKLPEAEQIKVTLNPLEFDDLMLIVDGMGGSKMVSEVRENGIEAAKENIDMIKFIKSVGNILPRYANDLSGLEGESGPVTTEDVVKYPAFMGLAVELLMELGNISMPSDDDEGNSEGQPG